MAASGSPGFSERARTVRSWISFAVAPHAALAEVAELAVVAAPLLQAGLAVSAVVVRVHEVAVGDELLDQRLIPRGVLAEAVHDLGDRPGGGRTPDVVVDRHAVVVDEAVLLAGHRGSGHRASLLAFILGPAARRRID